MPVSVSSCKLMCLHLQENLTDFSKRSRSAKFRLVPKFKKDKNNKNKETCATLNLPGILLSTSSLLLLLVSLLLSFSAVLSITLFHHNLSHYYSLE